MKDLWRSNLNQRWITPEQLIKICSDFNEIVEDYATKHDSIYGLRSKLAVYLTVVHHRSYEAAFAVLDRGPLAELKQACYRRFAQLKG